MYFNFSVCFSILTIFCKIVTSSKKCYDSRFYVDGSRLIRRFNVPNNKIFWTIPFAEYSPTEYTSPKIKEEFDSDPDIRNQSFLPKWNSKDGGINRFSFGKPYFIVNGKPQNPRGRTGIAGRGLLKRWGPNHAVDLIITRWKRRGDKIVNHPVSKKPVLQLIAISRKHCQELTLPEGMVPTNEDELITAKRVFMKEALGINLLNANDMAPVVQKVDDSFANRTNVYKGYMNDRRNTDNAWVETTIFHVHDAKHDSISSLKLSNGKKDKDNVRWIDVHGNMKLYTNRNIWIKTVVRNLRAHW